jgi:hypothetical protein
MSRNLEKKRLAWQRWNQRNKEKGRIILENLRRENFIASPVIESPKKLCDDHAQIKMDDSCSEDCLHI